MKPRAYYQPYQSGLLLAQAFSPSKTPLLRMEHLRQLDFPISREISYERTVDEFLLQLAVNDALRALRSRKDMVILLNEEGALIREDWHWSLLFTPNRSEKRTLDDSSDLYQGLCSLAQRRQDGEVCRVAVPDRSLKTLVSGSDPFCILDEFCKSQPGGYLAVAQNIVLEGTDHLFRHVPVCRYRVLSTVDLGEIENYHAIKTLLDEYIYAYDHRDAGEDAPKPISIAVFGPPGSGKSFGVKQIALSRGRFRITSLNLSQYDSVPQLFHALPGHQDLPGGRGVDGLGADPQLLGGKGAGPHDVPRHRIHQDPVAADGHQHPLPVRDLVHPLHMGGLHPVLPGGDVHGLEGLGIPVDPQGDSGEEEHLPHRVQLLIGQPPGVVVRPGHGGGDAQQGADPGPLVPVAVREDQLLLAHIAVLLEDLFQIAHVGSPFGRSGRPCDV